MSNKNILLQSFTADPDEPFYIQIGDVLVVYPIFRWNGVHWVEAVGDYDICLTTDENYLEFVSRRPGPETFAYRYLPLKLLGLT